MKLNILTPLEACIPTGGNGFFQPLIDLINQFSAALGDVLLPLTIIMGILLALAALLFMFVPKAREYMKATLFVFIIPIGLAFLILLFTILFTAVNNAC